jgi:site-specific recombinase XerD
MIELFFPEPQDLLPLRSGPLAPHLDRFATLLAHQGYCRAEGRRRVRLVADLSHWLAERRIRLEQFDEHQTTAFIQTRWKTYSKKGGELRTLKLLLWHLRQTGVIPIPRPPLMRSSLERLVGEYEQFLLQQRGLLPQSARTYLPVVRRFLRHRFSDGQVRLRHLQAGDAANFILQTSERCGRRSLQATTNVLRGFFRFLLQHGHITTPLANAVPTVAARRLAELPKSLEPVQIRKLLRSCDRRRKVGRRDYAILLLLARLGLRAGEVAQLCLEDIDWRVGEVSVRGKGRRVDRLPLPHDVGRAIANYLKTRPSVGSSRKVFLLSKAPYQGFAGSSSVGELVRRNLERAHLDPPHKGAHLLRHGLATRMLRGGASLTQIGQILRHQRAQTTQIYAKVDLNALRGLAQPWPGGAR